MPKPKTSKPVTSRKRSRTAPDVSIPATHPDPQAVATRAYELFMRRGGMHGNDWQDWLTAERELAGGAAMESPDYAG